VALALRKVKLDLLRIHAEDAGFLLTQRDRALEAPNYRLIDIYDLERRLHGHLDALVLARDAGADMARVLAEETSDGESAGVLLNVALRQGRRDLVDVVMGLAEASANLALFLEHLGRAAAWCSRQTLSTVIRDWIVSRNALLRWISFDVCGQYRVDPKHHLAQGLADPNNHVRARATRLAGEVGRADSLEQIWELDGQEAILASILLGHGARASQLAEVSSFPEDARTARRAAELIPLALSAADAQSALRSLLAHRPTRRWGIVGLGALGSAKVLPWLADAMGEPQDARVAVSAFERITGLYFAHDGLELSEFPESPEDTVVDADPGEQMIETSTPWPDVAKVHAWLDQNLTRLSEHERLLLGVPAWTIWDPPEPWIKFQSRYRAVALFQALQTPSRPCPNWRSAVSLHGGAFMRAW
jgi:uncharacterized protein (TIGR02270 family)